MVVVDSWLIVLWGIKGKTGRVTKGIVISSRSMISLLRTRKWGKVGLRPRISRKVNSFSGSSQSIELRSGLKVDIKAEFIHGLKITSQIVSPVAFSWSMRRLDGARLVNGPFALRSVNRFLPFLSPYSFFINTELFNICKILNFFSLKFGFVCPQKH